MRALRLGEKQILHLPRPNRPGKTPKAFLSQRRKARKGNSKATARMFAGEFSGPRQVSWTIDPGAAGAWALREIMLFKSSPADSASEYAVFVSRQGAKPAKESQRRKAADPEALRPARGLPSGSFQRGSELEIQRQKTADPEALRAARGLTNPSLRTGAKA